VEKEGKGLPKTKLQTGFFILELLICKLNFGKGRRRKLCGIKGYMGH